MLEDTHERGIKKEKRTLPASAICKGFKGLGDNPEQH
jgi:hypothetical protein